MAQETKNRPLNPVIQFSVFTENRVGRLHDLTGLLKRNNVHVMAITILDTTDSAIVRLILDDPDKASEILISNDFAYSVCNVMAVEIIDESQLNLVLSALLEAEINIHYIYSFIKRPEFKGGLAMRVEDEEVATQALSQRGLKILSQSDIAR
jgi:hypothetical protein